MLKLPQALSHSGIYIIFNFSLKIDAHSSSASSNNPFSYRYNRNLNLTNQEWYDLHISLPDTPIIPFMQPETPITDFITSYKPPSSSTTEVATSMTEKKSEV